jgi:hypothetical protein
MQEMCPAHEQSFWVHPTTIPLSLDVHFSKQMLHADAIKQLALSLAQADVSFSGMRVLWDGRA